MMHLNWNAINPEDEKAFVNEGILAEQFIGQNMLFDDSLGFRGQLHYWLRERKKGNAEVDYLLQYNTDILPIEIKSGTGPFSRNYKLIKIDIFIPF
jgi:hypothetical protein